MALNDLMISRRRALGLGAATLSALALAACDSEAPAPDATSDTPEEAQLDVTAYDDLIATGAVASDDEVAASEWASKVKEAGTLRVGGVLCADDVSLFADGVPPKRRMLARHISEFLADLQADPAFTTQILPVGKGLAVAVRGES